MHKCLQIAELFNRICRLILVCGSPVLDCLTNVTIIGRSTLVALCRTCRLLHEPALDVLYRSLESLFPLLCGLPAIITKFSQGRKTILLSQELRFSDWKRVQYYAKRVHSLKVSEDEEVIDKTILDALAASPFAPPLFTSLKKLSWSNNSIHALPLLCSLVNTKLQWLSLDQMDPTLFLHIVPLLIPIDNSLHVAHFPAEHSFRNLPHDVFHKWSKLQSLCCGLVNDATLYHFATFSKLTCLSIQVDEKNDYSEFMKLGGRPVFTALQDLNVAAIQTFHCIPILEIAELPSLRSLHIRSTETGLTDSELHRCFCLLSHHCPSLKELYIEEWQLFPPEFPVGYTTTFDILKVLHSLHHLEELHLDTTCTFSLNDEELAQLVGVWLKLRSFDLGTQNGWRQPSRITLNGLAEVLLRCPVLSVVGFAMDASAPDIGCRRPGGGVRRDGLKLLRVADSQIKDPFSVAAFLSDVAPNSEIAGYDFAYDIDGTFNTRMVKYQEKWEEVSRLHPLLVNLRRQEIEAQGLGR